METGGELVAPLEGAVCLKLEEIFIVVLSPNITLTAPPRGSLLRHRRDIYGKLITYDNISSSGGSSRAGGADKFYFSLAIPKIKRVILLVGFTIYGVHLSITPSTSKFY